MNFLAFINPQAALIWLGLFSTGITVAHNLMKFYRDFRSKDKETK
jgi:threonine/homoserine/homoserine lactone efflux protein